MVREASDPGNQEGSPHVTREDNEKTKYLQEMNARLLAILEAQNRQKEEDR